MSDACCAPDDGAPARDDRPTACTACGESGRSVDFDTVASLLRTSLRIPPRQAFRLCRATDCDTVYYGSDGAQFGVADVGVVPGFKVRGEEGLVCYCFLHDRAEIVRELQATGATTVPDRIKTEIEAGNCACEVRNPAGRCCLGEVNREVATLRETLAEKIR